MLPATIKCAAAIGEALNGMIFWQANSVSSILDSGARLLPDSNQWPSSSLSSALGSVSKFRLSCSLAALLW